jgi:anti-sigma B factor antagonist
MVECDRSRGRTRAQPSGPIAEPLQEDFVDLSLSTRTEGDRTIVEVGGEIDVYTAPRLREQLVDLVADGKYHLVVDMERVDFLDSTGLGVLVGGLKRVRAHDGSLRLVCTQERILKIFRITGLTKVFPIHSSVDEAVSATE